MYRITCIATVCLVQLLVASVASGATISISPTSGPVGTDVTYRGVAAECDEEPGADAEVFLLVGEFAASASVNPRRLVELEPSGAFAGTWEMPDPAPTFARSDGHGRDVRDRRFPVAVRCVGATGEHEGGGITPDPATFTFTARPANCDALVGARTAGSIDDVIRALGPCLDVTILGTSLANRIIGNVLANVLDGRGGNDVLRGLAGNDRIIGGSGADVAAGGAGNDTINANDSRPGDTVDGGSGTDTCAVNPGDTVRRCERVLVR